MIITDMAVMMVEQPRLGHGGKHAYYYKDTAVFYALCDALTRLNQIDKTFEAQMDALKEVEKKSDGYLREVARLKSGLRKIIRSMDAKESGKRARKIALEVLGDDEC